MNDQAIPAAVIERPAFVPGVFSDMPSETYHAIEALSASGSKKMLRSPAHYKLMRDAPAAPTAQMQFGTACHDGILEPASFADRVVVAPQVNKRTNAGKDELAAFEAAHAGKIVLSHYDFDRCRRVCDSVLAHPAARALLDGAIIEQSLFWFDAKYGIPCKSRIDIRNHGGIADLKTTTDASPETFGRSVASFLYHVQAAFNNSGHEHLLDSSMAFFAFIAVESEPPYSVACYSLPGNAVMAGARLCNIAAERYAEALKTGKWSGYAETIESLKFPKWALSFTE